jgi:AcrR family transcriptional regulator
MSTKAPPRSGPPVPDRPARGHRTALLEGAIECIHAKGYARTTARDIVAASGTNLASIGYHFGSKERLLNEAITEGFRRWLARLAAVAFEDQSATPLERLRRSLTELSETFGEVRPLMVAFTEALAQAGHSEAVREQLADSYRQTRAMVAAMVTECWAGAREIDAAQAPTIASVLIAVADGLMVQWLLDPDQRMGGTEILRSLEDGMALITEERT